MDYMPYTGVGLEQVEPGMKDIFTELGRLLALKGYTLRSGGERGVSEFLEKGANSAVRELRSLERPFAMVLGSELRPIKEIYLPYRGFNNHDDDALFNYEDRHLVRIKTFMQNHGVSDKINNWASPYVIKDCCMRMYQLMGFKLNQPSKMLVCWTPDGQVVNSDQKYEFGLTSVSIQLASHFEIPILNLGSSQALKSVQNRIKDLKLELGVR